VPLAYIPVEGSRDSARGAQATGGFVVIAVIFEVWPAEGRAAEYFELAAALKAVLEKTDGFISIERFESLATPGKFLSLSFWRDEEAVRAWRNLEEHRSAQAKGRSSVFADYRLRVAGVLRDYGMTERAQAPEDSRARHR
jgi:heme-degrading monooxygenase HmoA